MKVLSIHLPWEINAKKIVFIVRYDRNLDLELQLSFIMYVKVAFYLLSTNFNEETVYIITAQPMQPFQVLPLLRNQGQTLYTPNSFHNLQ